MTKANESTAQVLPLSQEEVQEMARIVLDEDGEEALRLLKKFVNRLKEQQNRGMKSHLG